jgi:N-methylhydantoinase A
MARHKLLTTPQDPADGALQGIDEILASNGLGAEDVEVVLHATTLVSNALIERKGARTALLATRGFRDILDLAREKKYDIYDLQLDKPKPLVPRALRFEVGERIAADGSIELPLEKAAVDAVVERVRECGAAAVAICLLHSYMNAVHEQALRDALADRLPGVAVSLSSEVLPEIREYERASTTAANAFVQPTAARYLQRFVEGLRQRGMRAPLFVMLSEGGIASPDLVRRFPVRICESGPAAGAVTAASVSKQRDIPQVLSFDMGGTTAKASLIQNGAPLVSTDFEVARMYRFKQGSGLPLKVPVVEMIEIGAGGGSIVRVDELGLIKVGPDSAGADPGPACYALGGTHATVTDADLVLGYLGESSFLGGRMPLDRKRAWQVIERQVAKPLGIDVMAAARGIHDLVNENMANAARVQAVERGHDLTGATMVAFGGAGPVHAWGVAKRLAAGCIVVPPIAGLGSALGLLLAPRSYQLSRTYIGTVDALDWNAVERIFTEMEADAGAALREAGVAADASRFVRHGDMRYLGQRKEITIELPPGRLGKAAIAESRRAFERQYRRIYHRIHEGHAIEALSWRLIATGPGIVQPRSLRTIHAEASPAGPPRSRSIVFDGKGAPAECRVYRRADLLPGLSIDGPCVVEEDESTVVIGPDGCASTDEYLNLIVTLSDNGAADAR